MEPTFPTPMGITNEALWRKHCRKIHARAKDLLSGRLGVIETARAMCPLASWTRAENEPEFQLFRAITSESNHLPVGEVRAHWAPYALAREDIHIRAVEDRWREQALAAAARLVERYKWAVKRKTSRADNT
ncbi:hypothetical protein [Paraburkholderia caffeinilytica]|uniref:Uncharacterized protein n=1 Tax=Paraburkholderia caffeinilytica TaxID=1761016 RepID=A0ABQ1N0I1_9BURK|nr:hypothetical protein [Paraburkholderia caffeinilytica]GGC50221.1 hypothetical protein GCM10011400_41980 [Paraburkholderia caffeinilytica]CAB3788407.1 hypothetical protein LMG28690_02651 [Paraburkholderia caffeinilytica]